MKPALSLFLALSQIGTVLAYPPAPYHLIYGVVRDEYGTPLVTSEASIGLKTPSGGWLEARLLPGILPGVNYLLKVPMDAGLTPLTYGSGALTASSSFKLFVVEGGITNLPIEMTGDFSRLGAPGKSTRLDLTLGVDSNADGLPDSWEYAVLEEIGSNLTLTQLNSSSILTGNGKTLLQIFLAGSDPLAPGDSITVTLLDYNNGAPILQFPAGTGQTYRVQGSTDLTKWSNLSFNLTADGPSGPKYSFYTAKSDQTVRVTILSPTPNLDSLFLRVQQQ